MPQREASPGAPDGDWVRKEEKVRPEAAPEGARRCAVARGRYGIVVGAGGQHGVCPVLGEDAPSFRTKRWRESEWCE